MKNENTKGTIHKSDYRINMCVNLGQWLN